MDISLKRAHFYCLLLLSHYLCGPAVGVRMNIEYEHCHSDLVNLCFVKTVS